MSDTQWLTIKPRELLAWDREARETIYIAEVPCSFKELQSDDRYLTWSCTPRPEFVCPSQGDVVCALRGDMISPIKYVYGAIGPGEYTEDGTLVIRRHIRFSGGIHVAI